MGLPKANRLKSRQDFSIVYQKGSRHRSKHLTLRVLRRRPIDAPSAMNPNQTEVAAAILSPNRSVRLGISISQKVSKRAVVRNRIKRQIRACFHQLLPKLTPGWDLVIVAHPQSVQCDYLQFLQELEQLLLNAEVLDGHS